MLDIGWSELMIIGVVALIVVGPKDLPKMFHTLGEFTAKARGMAREFQRAMNVAAKEAGMDDVAKMGKTLRSATNPAKAFKDAVGFDDIDKEFRDIGHDRPAVRKPTTPRIDPQTARPMADAGNDPGAVNDDGAGEAEGDALDAADHDADLARRNADLSAVESERLRKQQRAEAARLKAAAIRARKEAEAAEAAARRAEIDAANQTAAAGAEAWRPRGAPTDPRSES